ncbi:MAG: hypothetical protein AB1649_18790 [Chloroflexota bacterium]
MAEKKQTKIVVPPQGGVMRDMMMKIKLIVRLMADSRVSPLFKLLPVGALVYWLAPLPIDNVIPLLDDAAVVWLGSYLFIELCPPDVVQEHMQNLTSNLDLVKDDDVVDGESTDVT